MTFQPLLLRCECGRRTTRIREVGFTADHRLLVYWRCSACKQDVYVLKALSDCWRECPNEGDGGERTACPVGVFRGPDAVFLQSMGIKVPEGGDAPFCWDPPWIARELFTSGTERLPLHGADSERGTAG